MSQTAGIGTKKTRRIVYFDEHGNRCEKRVSGADSYRRFCTQAKKNGWDIVLVEKVSKKCPDEQNTKRRVEHFRI